MEFMPTCKKSGDDSFLENLPIKSDTIQMNVFSKGSESLNGMVKAPTINMVMNKLYDEFGTDIKCIESLSYENQPNGMYVETIFNNDGINMKFIPKLSKPWLLVENRCYDLFQSPQNATVAQTIHGKDATDLDEDFDSDALCAEDLLRFAKQIAVGMVNRLCHGRIPM